MSTLPSTSTSQDVTDVIIEAIFDDPEETEETDDLPLPLAVAPINPLSSESS